MSSPARRAPILGLITLATTVAVIGPATALDPGEAHLPNLQVRRAGNITLDDVAGELRFTNTVINVGDGPLELRPEHAPDDTTTAYQRIFTHDQLGAWSLLSESAVGTFIFHPTHDHWHFGGFARYQLRRVAPDGGAGKVIRAAADKVSFCLTDTTVVRPELEHAPGARVYPVACDPYQIQGISVGWADVYLWWLPDQSIDVTGVRDGHYWLTTTVDPDDTLAETDDTDNSRSRRITIADGEAVAGWRR